MAKQVNIQIIQQLMCWHWGWKPASEWLNFIFLVCWFSCLFLHSVPVWCRRNPSRGLWQADRSLFVSAGHHRGPLWLLQSWTLWLLPCLRDMSLLLLHPQCPETELQLGSGKTLPALPYSSRRWWLRASYPRSGGQPKSDPGLHLPSTQYSPTGRWCSVPTGQAQVTDCWDLQKKT